MEKSEEKPSKRTKMMTIDMRSDTVTTPTPEMRAAMMNAIVGDDVYGEDATVTLLQKKMAKMLGKESALFFPTGTMANLAALMAHANRRGDEIILGDRSHISLWEQGGVAQLAGIFPRQVRNLEDGSLDLEELQTKLHRGGRDGHCCLTKLVCVENTHNYSGGKPLSLQFMADLHAITSKNDIRIHVDGARLFNASTALKLDPAELVQHADSVSVCLSKGLGAPVGSMLAGSEAFIDDVHRIRKALGGGMRQCGVLAAAGIVALDTILPLFEVDHRNARLFAKLLQSLSSAGIVIDPNQVQSNMVLMKFTSSCRMNAVELANQLENPSDPDTPVMKILVNDEHVLRAVMHHQVSEEDVRLVASRILEIFKC